MAVQKKYNRNAKTNALGRGLDALISTEAVSTQGSSTINEVALDQIEANPNQPRREFDPVALEELANSIRELGLVQPITLRQVDENRFQIIAGERRWRASQLAGLKAVPAYIRTIKDENVMELALVENIQREDLNAIEIALAYEHLLEKSGMTQERVAERVGKSRAAIANYLRLLKLPALVQRRVAAGVLSAGHARALLMLTDQAQIETLAQKIVNEGLSVRAVEELVAAASGAEDKKQRKEPRPQKHRERLDYIADAFADKLDTSVKISLGARKGKMTIEFANVDDLNRIIKTLDTNFEN